MNADARGADFDNLAVKHFISLWHASDGSETHFEDDISTSVLDVPIANLPVFLLVVLAE